VRLIARAEDGHEVDLTEIAQRMVASMWSRLTPEASPAPAVPAPTPAETDQHAPVTLSVEETAQRLGISRGLCYEKARRNELPVPVIRIGKRMVIPRAAVDRLLSG
jgi:excisionase family DNA binding protein